VDGSNNKKLPNKKIPFDDFIDEKGVVKSSPTEE